MAKQRTMLDEAEELDTGQLQISIDDSSEEEEEQIPQRSLKKTA